MKLTALSLAGLMLPPSWLPPLRADTFFGNIFGDVSLASRIGRLYQASHPDAGARGRALVADLAVFPWSSRQKRLRERTNADLEALDVVVVDGWLMARSEAELCAAVHLDRNLA